MYFSDFLRVIRRYWFVVAPAVAFSLLAATVVYTRAPLSYQSQSDVVFLPVPKPATAKAAETGNNNPYLNIGRGLRPAMDVVSRILSDDATKAVMSSTFPGASYVVAAAPNTAAPILTAVVTSQDRNEADQALAVLVARIESTTGDLQKTARALTDTPPNTVIVPRVVSQTPATGLRGSGTRAAIAVGVIALAISLSLPFLLDAMRRRRQVFRAVPIDDWPELEGMDEAQRR